MENIGRMAIYLGLIAAITLAGGIAPLLGAVPRGRLPLLVAFGGGVLLGAAFICMLPATAAALGDKLGFPVLAGFLAIFVLEKYVLVHPCGEVGCEIHPIGMAAFGGMSFHSLLDGVAVGSSLMVPSLAAPVLVAIVIHKMPAAFSLSSILLLAHYRRRKALMHTVFFALTTPLGAVLAYVFLHGRGMSFVGVAVGVSAGSFLAIATSDLMAQIHRTEVQRAGTLISFLAGIAVMAATGLVPGH